MKILNLLLLLVVTLASFVSALEDGEQELKQTVDLKEESKLP